MNIMYRLLLILILTFSFQSWTKADDINDLEIAGMSLGDSLLEYYTESKLNLNKSRTNYPGSDKYYSISIVEKTYEYDGMKFDVKSGDKKYLIAGMDGRIHFEETSKCLKKKKEIINEIVFNIKVKKRDDYEFEYPQYIKSKAIITDLSIEGGDIRIWCDDISKETREKFGLIKSLAVSISSDVFANWLKNEAY